jgi:hypothetical protein
MNYNNSDFVIIKQGTWLVSSWNNIWLKLILHWKFWRKIKSSSIDAYSKKRKDTNRAKYKKRLSNCLVTSWKISIMKSKKPLKTIIVRQPTRSIYWLIYSQWYTNRKWSWYPNKPSIKNSLHQISYWKSIFIRPIINAKKS